MKVQGSIISAIHEARVCSRVVTGITLFFFSWMNIAPAAAAVGVKTAGQSKVTSAAPTETALGLQDLLNQRLENIAKRAAKAKSSQPGGVFIADRQAIKELQVKVGEQDRHILEDFQADLKHIEKYRLSDVIRQRHDEAQAKFQREAASVQAQLAALLASDDKAFPELTQELLSHLKSLEPKRHVPFNPRKLPFKVADGKVRKPGSTREELQQLLSSQPKVSSVAVPSSGRKQEIGMLQLSQIQNAAKVGDRYDKKSDSIQVASIGSLSGLLAMSTYMPPTSADLAATDDVQITPEIQALAAQLNNNPVQIYNWVYNNIQFIPSYGSIQGSDRALQTQKANAIDTASLLIALLRAGGTPAHYVYGTVNIPVAQVESWVGGADSPEVAMELLGQMGIPNEGLALNGTIVAIQLEQVWVEAYVYNQPSRGVASGGGKTWVPLDASFKQYTYQLGMDIVSQPPFDAQPEWNQITTGASYDSSTGAITGLNPANTDGAVGDMVSQLSTYEQSIQAQNTLGPFTERTIVDSTADVLPSGLPYQVATAGWTASTLPASLRATFSASLSGDPSSADGGGQAFTYQASLVSLGGKKIAFQFVPATPQDAQTIASYFPPKSDGTPYTLSELPTTLTGYEIHLVAELTVDGQVVAQGGQFDLGDAAGGDISIALPSGTTSEEVTQMSAGEYVQIALDLGAFSMADHDKVDQLTNVSLIGEAAVGYWSEIEGYLEILRGLNLAMAYRQPSFGAISTRIETQYSYGVPNKVTLSGVRYDIGGLSLAVVPQSSSQMSMADVTQGIGMFASTMEHAGAEEYFASTDYPAQAVSAIKALTLALENNANLYVIDSSNLSNASSLINASADVMEDINNSVNAGNQVVIADQDVNVNGVVARGYIILDPQTGSGAYKVSTGANGSVMNAALGQGLSAMGLNFLGVVVPPPLSDTDANCGQPHKRVKVSLGDKIALAALMTLIAILTKKIPIPPVPALSRALSPADSPGGIPVAAVNPMIAYFVAVRRATSFQQGCSTYISSGSYFGKSMIQTTQHIAAAQGLHYLTYWGPFFEWDRSWYNSDSRCNAQARDAFKSAQGVAGACDEYPFAKALQGGQENGASLKLVPNSESSPQGLSTRWFYLSCNVGMFDDFEVFANTDPNGITRGLDMSGNQCMRGQAGQ